MARPGDGVLVGLSGGADSVGLLLVLWKLRETFQISLRALHVHHGLRGAEADRDAAFSRMLCERLEIPFYEFRIDAAKEALDRKCSVEEAGRLARYRLYEETAAAVAVCDDKAATHLELARRGVPMPRTLVAPMTYVNMDAQGDAFLRRGAETLGFPLVVKECFGSLGGQVYLARDRGQLCRLADTMGPKPFLLQQFVAASAGEDKRLYVVGGRVAAAMRRRSEMDFRANIGGGGRGEACSPTAEEERLALECAAILGAEIAGVDLLQSETGPLVCEVNSNAHFAALTACTGVDVAGLIADYVLQREE